MPLHHTRKFIKTGKGWHLFLPALLLCLAFLTGIACGEKIKSVNRFGISFNCPEGCRIEEEVAVGHYDRIHCTSDHGNFFSISAIKDNAPAEIVLQAYKTEFEQQFRQKGAKDITFTDLEETVLGKKAKGFLMTFTLDNVPLETRNFCIIHNGRPLSITEQYFAFNRKTAEKFFANILSSLVVK